MRSKLFLILAVSTSLVLMCIGCTLPQNAMDIEKLTNPPDITSARATDNPTRFQDPWKNPTAIESAIKLSQEHAEVADKLAETKLLNGKLARQNESLQKQNNELQSKLNQSITELDQANELLVSMKLELNNWKDNVLGFRDEIKSAQQAQLEALLKIMQVLGGKTDQDFEITSAAKQKNDNNNS